MDFYQRRTDGPTEVLLDARGWPCDVANVLTTIAFYVVLASLRLGRRQAVKRKFAIGFHINIAASTELPLANKEIRGEAGASKKVAGKQLKWTGVASHRISIDPKERNGLAQRESSESQ